MYIADTGNLRIRQVNPSGIINTVAGNGQVGENGDNGPAASARLNFPYDVTVGSDGSIYIADTSNVMIRRVSPTGNISIYAGIGTKGSGGDGGSALQEQFSMPMGMALGSDGSLYVADGWLENSSEVRKIASPMPGYGSGQYTISSEDGGEVYVFDQNGRHLQTVEPLWGALRYQFAYDSSGRVTSVTDGSGNVTTVQRNAAGNATAIVGPYGQTTTLSYDGNGNLASVTDPLGLQTTRTFGTGGLLASVTNPRGYTQTLSTAPRNLVTHRLGDRSARLPFRALVLAPSHSLRHCGGALQGTWLR